MDRQNEGAAAEGRAVPRLQQGQQRGLGCRQITPDRLADRELARDLAVFSLRERQPIGRLRPGIVAHQIVGQSAIGKQACGYTAIALGLFEQAQRLHRLAAAGGDRGQPRQYPAVVRPDRARLAQIPAGRIGVAQRQPGQARIDLGIGIVRVAAEAAQCVVEIVLLGRREFLNHFARNLRGSGNDGKCCQHQKREGGGKRISVTHKVTL